MAQEFASVSLYAEHIPDDHPDKDYAGELPGFVEVGVVVDGARIPLQRVKAGDVLEAVKAAKENRSDNEPGAGDGGGGPEQGF